MNAERIDAIIEQLATVIAEAHKPFPLRDPLKGTPLILEARIALEKVRDALKRGAYDHDTDVRLEADEGFQTLREERARWQG